MKKLTAIALCVLPACVFAQFSNKSAGKVPAKDTIANTVDLKLHLSSDTAKAKIVLFAKGDTDRFLSWTDGYIVTKSYKLSNGQVAGTVGNLAYTLKWELIRPEDVYDVKVTEQPNK
ncbi:hypothetical protein [Sediminibacterium ginsengisoli]|uniref:Uncharacterized protein n=1 Tax=Sediminibacterium ginsengisoli TaxID=413434 RepID=A0A1T4PP19_9BACT|nr:hypothetical protein [Sediminibacterium ginsengisoli]SJZ93179.1 hypothetical protein SAMN04488132_106129 [Sediminibacterium ginsengisoli]